MSESDDERSERHKANEDQVELIEGLRKAHRGLEEEEQGDWIQRIRHDFYTEYATTKVKGSG